MDDLGAGIGLSGKAGQTPFKELSKRKEALSRLGVPAENLGSISAPDFLDGDTGLVEAHVAAKLLGISTAALARICPKALLMRSGREPARYTLIRTTRGILPAVEIRRVPLYDPLDLLVIANSPVVIAARKRRAARRAKGTDGHE